MSAYQSRANTGWIWHSARIDRQCWEVVGAVSVRRRLRRHCWCCRSPSALRWRLVLIFRWGGEGAVRTVDSLTLVASSGLCDGMCGTGRSIRLWESSRRAWTMLSVALAAGTFGNAFGRFAYKLCWGAITFPSSAGGPFYVAFTLADWQLAIDLLPRRADTGSRLRSVLDGITATLCIFLLMWIGRVTRCVRHLRRQESRRNRYEGAPSDRRPGRY